MEIKRFYCLENNVGLFFLAHDPFNVPSNNMECAVVSDSFHIPSMICCARVIFVYYLSHTRNFYPFLLYYYCFFIIIIIVIIIKHFYWLKTVILSRQSGNQNCLVSIWNIDWLNSIGCTILFWSTFYVNTKKLISANCNVLITENTK